MKVEKSKTIRRRLRNSYTSSVISISLVLLLVGAAALLVVNSRRVSEYFKENMQLTVLMKQGVGEKQTEEYMKEICRLPYVKDARMVSIEEGTAELKAMLGDDFLSVFESSPVPVSVELTLLANYVSTDSLDVVIPVLSASPLVDEVDCQKSLVDALNANLARISLVISVFVLLLLFISVVLINNTVRLSVFSQRFTLHTMKLVGATKSFIRRPFLISSIIQGLVASLVALALLSCGVLFIRRSFFQLFEIFTWQTLAISAGIVLACGVLLCLLSTYVIVGRLVSMDKDDLYY